MVSNLLRLGNKCNEACIFCTVANDNEKELSSEEAKKAIRQIARHSKTISFTGGEPTTRSDLAELVECAKRAGIKKIELQSNALLLDKKTVLRLRKAGLSHAFIALHSHKRETSEALVGRKNSFGKTVSGIKNLLSAGIPTTISHVINSLNYTQLTGFSKFVEANFPGINSIYFGLVRPNGRCAENAWLSVRLTELQPCLARALEYCNSKKIFFEIEGIPLCHTIGFEENNVESRRLMEEPVVYIGSSGTKQNIHRKYLAAVKAKGRQCSLCYLDRLCCGVWKEYAALHGTFELFPQYTDPKEAEAKIRRHIQ